MSALEELAPGLHHWTARHPEWHPSSGDGFGAEVGCFALTDDDGALLLIDPLVAEDDALDTLAAAASDTYIFITIGYHVRSAARLSARYDATVHGPPQAGERLPGAVPFTVLAPGGAPGPGGVTAHAIGRPRRGETPLWLPSHRAVAFGDALVRTPGGELRMWCQDPDAPSAARSTASASRRRCSRSSTSRPSTSS